MEAELAAWNSGKGINLEGWVCCEGNFRLAVGYSTVFWPNFVEFENYILVEGYSEEAIREYASQPGNTPKIVEATNNHLHIADIQYVGCDDISKDKIIHLGNILKEIYQAKLSWLFPDKPCVVEFYQPEDSEDLIEYQITFWQKKHE